jgi:hypothetical protein
MKHKSEGYGYEWDAKLYGGPADGCVDIVIQINGKEPPKYIKRILDGQEIERESIGEKLIEYLTQNNLDENQRVAVYKLKEFLEDEDSCTYDYVETLIFKEYRIKYESQ